MAKNVEHVSHIKSKLKTNGLPQLPSPDKLVDGEIAINYAEGVETISIRNENSAITTFSSDNYYTEKKLGSGFTGNNVTVTDVIAENERIISNTLNYFDEKKLDVSAYTPTDLSNYYTKSETSGASQIASALNNYYTKSQTSGASQIASAFNNYYTKSETSGKTEIANALNGKTDTATTTALNNVVTAHTANTNIHLTTTEKGQLHTHDNKTYLDGITGSVGTMAYQNTSSYSSATQVNTALAGKTNTATTTALNNVVTAHTANTSIHLTATEKANIDSLATNIAAISGITSAKVSNWNTAYSKVSGVTASTTAINSITGSVGTMAFQNTGSYSSATQVSTALSNKQDKATSGTAAQLSAGTDTTQRVWTAANLKSGGDAVWQAKGSYVTTTTYNGHTGSTVHMTTTEKTNLDSLSTNIKAISGITSTKVSNWDTAYTNNHTHSNKSTLDGITATSAAINSLTGAVGTMAFQNSSSYSSATQVNTALAGKSGTGHTHYWANLQVSSAANYITEPEIKSVKINGSTSNAASTNNCHIQYDTTNKCLKFLFN